MISPPFIGVFLWFPPAPLVPEILGLPDQGLADFCFPEFQEVIPDSIHWNNTTWYLILLMEEILRHLIGR